MYARSTTVQAQPDRIDAGVRYLEDKVLPALLDMSGCIGLSALVDRESGQCIVTSAWESADAMHDSNAGITPIRNHAAEAFAGRIDDVREWTIALMHREHRAEPGSCVRCTWIECSADRVDAVLAHFRTDTLPALEAIDGFCSASLFADHAAGSVVAAPAWDSRAAMEASRSGVGRLRNEFADRFQSTIAQVSEFDLAVSRLRVPELA